MLQDAKQRAKKSGIVFDLVEGDIRIPSKCPVLGIPLQTSDGRASHNSPSLDRIDPGKGYTIDNVIVVSHRANTLKRDASIDELRRLARFYKEIK